jgi:hypothetical protein
MYKFFMFLLLKLHTIMYSSSNFRDFIRRLIYIYTKKYVSNHNEFFCFCKPSGSGSNNIQYLLVGTGRYKSNAHVPVANEPYPWKASLNHYYKNWKKKRIIERIKRNFAISYQGIFAGAITPNNRRRKKSSQDFRVVGIVNVKKGFIQLSSYIASRKFLRSITPILPLIRLLSIFKPDQTLILYWSFSNTIFRRLLLIPTIIIWSLVPVFREVFKSFIFTYNDEYDDYFMAKIWIWVIICIENVERFQF